MPGDDPDRRRSARFAARIRVRFRSVDELVTAYTEDVSKGGLFVTAPRQLPKGSQVLLSLELPDGGPPAKLAAEVAYVVDPARAEAEGKAPGMGMRFTAEEVAWLAERIASFLADSVGSGEHERPEPIHALVVDDSSTWRAVVRGALAGLGHRVTEAEHGLDALGKAMRAPPDVVLTDVNMPVMDGWQLLRLLRARDSTARVPVVFMSTLASEQDRIRGYELGVDDYLAKPVAADELVARVTRVVMRNRWEGIGDAEEATSMSGDLRQVSIASLLAFSEAERRTGWISVQHRHRLAHIGLRGGVIVAAEIEDAPGPSSLLERILEILDWEDGRFTLRELDVVVEGESIGAQLALMEHARRKDEANRS